MSVNKSILDFEKIINKKFHAKYYIEPNYYNIIKIENIIYNDKSHLVSEFKEQMIMNDKFEYFSKYYLTKEIHSLLIKCILYYEKNSFLIPNYVVLPEGKYIYKNIIEKQQLIEDKVTNYDYENNNDKLAKNKKKENKNNNGNKKIFDYSVYNSIMKGSSFSVFDTRKNSDKLDSIADINNLILEINSNKDSLNIDDEKQNQIYLRNKENKENIKSKLNRNNNNYIKHIYIINKTNEKNLIHSNENEKNFSYIYIKSNIRQKILNNRMNFNDKLNDNKNDILFTPLNTTQLKTIINNNNSFNQKKFIYRKTTPLNTNNKLNYTIKTKNFNNKKELLKRVWVNNKKSSNKKPDLNIEIFSYANKPNNIINYTIKNQCFNINKTDLFENKTPIKENKISIIRRKFNTEINLENKTKKFVKIKPRENAIYIFNNNCINKQNLNINYKKIEPKVKVIQNKNKSSLQKDKKKINNVSKKKKSFTCIINSIRKKIKKESKNNISQRIIDLMKSKKELLKINQNNSYNELNKNIISLNKFIKMNKKRNELESELKNKLILTLKETNLKNISNSNSKRKSKTKTLYNREFKNSNFSLNMIKLNVPCKTKIHLTNKINPKILSNLTSPSPIKNKIFINYNTINTSKNKRNNCILNTETYKYKNYIKNKNNLYQNTLFSRNEFNNIKLITKPEKKISKNNISKISCKKLSIITNKIKRNILIANNNINTNNINNLKIKEISKIKDMNISQQNNTMKNILKNDIKFN